MKRLSEIMNSISLTREAVAGALGVSTREVALWEASRKKPAPAVWRDLAILCGTSAPDLDSEKYERIATCLPVEKAQGRIAGFWGYLGISVASQPELAWYPIDSTTAGQLEDKLGAAEEEKRNWIVASTLNNLVLVLAARAAKHIALLSRAAAERNGAAHDHRWQPYPAELYRALEDRFFGEDNGASLPSSPPLCRRLDELERDWGLTDMATRDRLLRHARVVFRDGSSWTERFDAEQSFNAVIDADACNPSHLRLSSNGIVSFYPSTQVALIEIPQSPYVEAIDAAIREMQR